MKFNNFWFLETLESAHQVGLLTVVPALGWPSFANAARFGCVISGPPIKDMGIIMLRLPINNKSIREVQNPLEDITDSLKLLESRPLIQLKGMLGRLLEQGKSLIISGLAESNKDHSIELLAKLEVGMDELQKIVEDKKWDAVASKQKELLQYVGGVYLQSIKTFVVYLEEC